MNQELDLVETYWGYVGGNETGGAALLGIARHNIEERNRMLNYIEESVKNGMSVDEACYNAKYGIHMRNASGCR